jgi:hypothetical protein
MLGKMYPERFPLDSNALPNDQSRCSRYAQLLCTGEALNIFVCTPNSSDVKSTPCADAHTFSLGTGPNTVQLEHLLTRLSEVTLELSSVYHSHQPRCTDHRVSVLCARITKVTQLT